MVFKTGYSDDIEKAEEILKDIIENHPLTLKDPEPTIRMHALADFSVDFICRPWVKTEDYWNLYWDVTKNVKHRFDEEGIDIPYPKQDVHLYIEKMNKDELA